MTQSASGPPVSTSHSWAGCYDGGCRSHSGGQLPGGDVAADDTKIGANGSVETSPRSAAVLRRSCVLGWIIAQAASEPLEVPGGVPPVPCRSDSVRAAQHQDLFPFDTEFFFGCCEGGEPGIGFEDLTSRREPASGGEPLRDGDEPLDGAGELAVAIQALGVPASGVVSLPSCAFEEAGGDERGQGPPLRQRAASGAARSTIPWCCPSL